MITGIGSLPFEDVDRAIDLIFSVCRQVPFWPQLPKRSFFEDMYVQSLYPMPGLVLDRDEGKVYVDTEQTRGIEQFYEDVYAGRIDAFPLFEEGAPGFYRFLERLPEIEDGVQIIKGQLTGPFTLGLGLRDQNGKSILFDASYFDIVKKSLNMRAKWMVRTIRSRYPEKEIILFFDEPFMVSFGSAYVSVSKEEVAGLMNEVLDGIDVRTGIHCCGNTDWSVLLNVRTDVINYDAFSFMETIFYFKEELIAFLNRGGQLSPGIIPSTHEGLTPATPTDMKRLWHKFRGLLEDTSISARLEDWLITPSCGLGSVSEEEAVKAFELLRNFETLQP
jgi:methionine synthase II (cobalamin-independent)